LFLSYIYHHSFIIFLLYIDLQNMKFLESHSGEC
jgi:hypothetical protein